MNHDSKRRGTESAYIGCEAVLSWNGGRAADYFKSRRKALSIFRGTAPDISTLGMDMA
jgi:hypothetical protein